ncbi:MAG TPA: hypothetical protein VGY99_02505 [Candidatus Binataceae bacterium]|nr:hypothetical protein [Candidatus Binataceae bacterium]
MGILSSDGVSKVSGQLTENKHGTICQFALSGTYTVNPNGTGVIDVNSTTSSVGCTGTATAQVSVLFNMGNGAAFINTTTGVSLGSLTKQ